MLGRTIVCDDTNRDLWLSKRREYLTASDIPTYLGLSKWSTPEEIVQSKVGDPEPWDSPAAWHGRISEHHNAEVFCYALGCRWRPCHYMVARGKVSCTLDGLVIPIPGTVLEPLYTKSSGRIPMGDWMGNLKEDMLELYEKHDECGILELKSTSDFFAKEWQKTIPVYYSWQVQTQLYATGKQWGVIACKIGSANAKAFIFEKDEYMHETIEETGKEFWERLNNG